MSHSITKRWTLGALLVGIGAIVALSVSLGAGAGTDGERGGAEEHLAADDHGHGPGGQEARRQQGHLERQRVQLHRLLAALRQGRRKLRQHQRRQRPQRLRAQGRCDWDAIWVEVAELDELTACVVRRWSRRP